MLTSLSAKPPSSVAGVIFQLSNFDKQKIDIRHQMRAIEGELFLLSGKSGDLDVEKPQYFEHLCRRRTQLAGELLLIDLR
jgi:hypothetical protein